MYIKYFKIKLCVSVLNSLVLRYLHKQLRSAKTPVVILQLINASAPSAGPRTLRLPNRGRSPGV